MIDERYIQEQLGILRQCLSKDREEFVAKVRHIEWVLTADAEVKRNLTSALENIQGFGDLSQSFRSSVRLLDAKQFDWSRSFAAACVIGTVVGSIAGSAIGAASALWFMR